MQTLNPIYSIQNDAETIQLQPLEAQAVDKGMIARLSYLGCIIISGVDAFKFLQGQLTCNVAEVTEHQSRLGAHCNPKGRMLFSFRLYQFQDAFYMVLPHNMIDIAMNALKKYAVFFKVKLESVMDNWMAIGINGKNAIAHLEKLNIDLPQSIDEVKQNQSLILTSVVGINPRIEIYGKGAELLLFFKNLEDHAKTVNEHTWQLLDIFANLAIITPTSTALFTPHEIGFEKINGVSFNKGCYTGQEIIARMHYRGKLKYHLQHLAFHATQPSEAGTPIYSGEKMVGHIVNVVVISNNHYAILATVNDKL